jgi:acetyl-CoA C-acetyltransferase
LLYSTKVSAIRGEPYAFPSVRKAMIDALGRADMADIYGCYGVEVHDCFSITECMAIDHFGITAPGESRKAVEDGTIAIGGELPVNPLGSLLGLGRPVGATGVRMTLDAWSLKDACAVCLFANFFLPKATHQPITIASFQILFCLFLSTMLQRT